MIIDILDIFFFILIMVNNKINSYLIFIPKLSFILLNTIKIIVNKRTNCAYFFFFVSTVLILQYPLSHS
jgi:hypothetical protein